MFISRTCRIKGNRVWKVSKHDNGPITLIRKKDSGILYLLPFEHLSQKIYFDLISDYFGAKNSIQFLDHKNPPLHCSAKS